MLTPDKTGVLHGNVVPRTPLSSTRWQGVFDATGISELAVWGAGGVGELRFEPPLSSVTDVEVRPNEVLCSHGTGSVRLLVHPELPRLGLSFTGKAPMLRLVPPREPQDGFSDTGAMVSLEGGWRYQAPWALCELLSADATSVPAGRLQPADGADATLYLAATPAELRSVRARANLGAGQGLELEEAVAQYQHRVLGTFRSSDAMLNSMFVAGLSAALSSRKADAEGRFAGFAAGTSYCTPARTYYRDSYWTVQVLLPLDPWSVEEQLKLLALGISEEGQAPAAVITADEAGMRAWEARRAGSAALQADHRSPREWWSDHTDSPLYFVILAGEVADWTGNHELHLHEVGGRTIGQIVASILDSRTLGAGALPLKPNHDRDWADNVFRAGRVTYDAGLYHGALVAAARLFQRTDPRHARRYAAMAEAARQEAALTVVAELGSLIEMDTAAPALSLDSLTAVRYGLVTEAAATATLRAMESALESRNNARQPYGDWGTLCRWPLYDSAVKRRGKSLFAYRYHNGSVWPYLNGLYAETVMASGRPNWRYALTRWWEYCLEQGWPAPVEYYSPPWGRGSLVNAWGAMPAAAMLFGGLGLRARGAPEPRYGGAPWGISRLAGVLVDGRVSTLNTTAEKVEVESGD